MFGSLLLDMCTLLCKGNGVSASKRVEFSIFGIGEFGVVYKGYIKKGYSEALRETVAVKTLKGWCSL